MSWQLVPLVALAPVLIWVAVSDLREMKIPNLVVLIALGSFVVWAPFLGWHEVGMRGLAAAVTFAIGYVLFALRAVGGGDVKFLSVLMLFVPSAAVAQFLMLFSLALVLGSIMSLLLQTAPVAARLHWKSAQVRGKLPMGMSFAMSGLALPYFVAGL